MVSTKRVTPSFQDERTPITRSYYSAAATITRFFLAGVGPSAAVTFGGIDASGQIDPASYAGQFGETGNLVFADYAPCYDEERMFDAWLDYLRGDVEAHVLSGGAKVFFRFLQYCRQPGRSPMFRVTRVVFINPVTDGRGLKIVQRLTVQVCRFVARFLPELVRSRRLQRLWEARLWKMWQPSRQDKAYALRTGRYAAYEKVVAAARSAQTQRIIAATAALSWPAFDTAPAAADFEAGVIIAEHDPVLRARHNAGVIRRYFGNDVRVVALDGGKAETGGHDSLYIHADSYIEAYRQLIA